MNGNEPLKLRYFLNKMYSVLVFLLILQTNGRFILYNCHLIPLSRDKLPCGCCQPEIVL